MLNFYEGPGGLGFLCRDDDCIVVLCNCDVLGGRFILERGGYEVYSVCEMGISDSFCERGVIDLYQYLYRLTKQLPVYLRQMLPTSFPFIKQLYAFTRPLLRDATIRPHQHRIADTAPEQLG